MRKLLIATGVSAALVVLPVSASAGAAGAAKFKGKGSGTIVLQGTSFTIDGTVKVAKVGAVPFHTEGSLTGARTAAFTTTFTAPNGDTLTTSSTGTARQTRIGRVFITKDTVTGGTGRFAGATGAGRTAAKANLRTGVVKFVLAGRIVY
jgi:hypothetical protein